MYVSPSRRSPLRESHFKVPRYILKGLLEGDVLPILALHQLAEHGDGEGVLVGADRDAGEMVLLDADCLGCHGGIALQVLEDGGGGLHGEDGEEEKDDEEAQLCVKASTVMRGKKLKVPEKLEMY